MSRPRLEHGEVSIVTVLDDDAIEAMVDAMVKQSTAYPVVPPGYTRKVEPLHPFTARQCLLAALRCQPQLAELLRQGLPRAPEPRTHTFRPDRKYPWFCGVCGYGPDEPLQHTQA